VIGGGKWGRFGISGGFEGVSWGKNIGEGRTCCGRAKVKHEHENPQCFARHVGAFRL
jgi:hypothetical protein